MPHAVYLYCIVRRASRPPLARMPSGVPDGIRPVAERFAEGLWFVSAAVPLARYGPGALEASLQDLDWVSRVALAHDAVVAHVARAPDAAVIPMKLFTIFSTLERARSALQNRASNLKNVFERIAGCEEWGVRVSRPMGPPVPRVGQARTGTAFLQARRQARQEAADASRAAAQTADRVFDSLAKLARAERRRPPAAGLASSTLLDAAFLVPLRRRARFHAAAERMAGEVARSGARMTLTGPWPPYNFVEAGEAV